MQKLPYPVRNFQLVAITLVLAMAAFFIATSYFMPVHALMVLLFWFVVVPIMAYYVAFQFNLRKQTTSSKAIAALMIFYAIVMGVAYERVDSPYIQIIVGSCLPVILAVYYIQLVIKRIPKDQRKSPVQSEAAR
jgi:FtsH-binding integral membrane protein